MQMDMQEPGEMCSCCWEEHDLAIAQRAGRDDWFTCRCKPYHRFQHSSLSITQAA
jgi:hypothetical protein